MWDGAYGNFQVVEVYNDSAMYIVSSLGLRFNTANYERLVISTDFIADGSISPPSNIVATSYPVVSSGGVYYTYGYIENLEVDRQYTFYCYAQAVKNKWYPGGIHGQYFLLNDATITTGEPTDPVYEVSMGKGYAYGATKLALDTDHPCMLHIDVVDKGTNYVRISYVFPEKIRVFGSPEHIAIARTLLNSNKYDFDYALETPDSYNHIRRSDLVLGGPRVEGGVTLLQQNRAMRLWGNNNNDIYASIYDYMANDVYSMLSCSFEGILTCLRIEPYPIVGIIRNINIRWADQSAIDKRPDGNLPPAMKDWLFMMRLINK